MSDLQIGLLAVGAVVVAGVIAYNVVQERRARRSAEKAFGTPHADVLLDEADARREPSLELPPRHSAMPAGASLPDPRLDYVIDLALRQSVPAAEVVAHWSPFEHRFAGRALLSVSAGDDEWRPLAGTGACRAVRAALQLVSRAGPVSEAELIEFRGAADTLAANTGASVSAPETRQALETARELDQLCADADIQVVLHVVPQPDAAFPSGTDGGAGDAFVVSPREGGGFVLSLDVPRTTDVRRAYDDMVVHARDLCARLGGKIVDDNGQALDERALGAIGGQLEAVAGALRSRGIEPGGALALRLFA